MLSSNSAAFAWAISPMLLYPPSYMVLAAIAPIPLTLTRLHKLLNSCSSPTSMPIFRLTMNRLLELIVKSYTSFDVLIQQNRDCIGRNTGKIRDRYWFLLQTSQLPFQDSQIVLRHTCLCGKCDKALGRRYIIFKFSQIMDIGGCHSMEILFEIL